jgi:transposase
VKARLLVRPIPDLNKTAVDALIVLGGAKVVEATDRFGPSGQSVHDWLAAYRDAGLAGLNTKSRRPDSTPYQAGPAVEAAV